jgi:DNA-binding NarL/FixJ family response regulator
MKLLIVEDHPMVREGLIAFLRATDEGLEALEAGDAETAMTLALAPGDIDLALVDLGLPGRDGLSLIGDLARLRPALPVIALTASNDPRAPREALAAGARGFVPKSANGRALRAAIELVLCGGTGDASASRAVGLAPRDAGEPALTPRQRDVLGLVGEGRSNKHIASALGLSEKTVKAHISGVLRVLGVANRTQAALARTSFGRDQTRQDSGREDSGREDSGRDDRARDDSG